MSASSYYDQMLEEGMKYQDFVAWCFWKYLCYPICMTTSRYSQYNIGESFAGVEIKYDRRLEETGNLYIEYAEKACPRDGQFVRSGILRNDNAWLYAIGNYREIYIFGVRTLKNEFELDRSRKFDEKKYQKVETATSL